MGVSRHGGGPPAEQVLAAQSGDPAAVDALLEFSLPLVYNIVGHGLAGHSDTDDLVQETMLHVLNGLPHVREPGAFRSWVCAVAVRQVRWHLAERARAPRAAALEAAGAEPADPQADFVDLCILRLGLTGQRREIAEATRWLDDSDRELLGLWWQETAGRLQRSELAAALAVSPQHAAVRVQRMKQQLDGARTVVRALRRNPQCTGLAATASSWNRVPNPLWRKRLNRHVRDCPECLACARELVPAEGLLAGIGLVPIAIGSPLHALTRAAALHQPVAQMIAQPVVQANGQPVVQTNGQPVVQSNGQPVQAHQHFARQVHPTRSTKHAGHARALGHLRAFSLGKVVGAVAVTAAVVTTSVVALNVSHPAPGPVAAQSPSPGAVAATVSPSAALVLPSITAATTKAATPTPTTAPAIVPAATAPAGSKKGAATWSFSGINTAFKESGVSWYYTWGADHSGISDQPGVQFVPMIWGAASVTANNLADAKQNSAGVLLGFNEPDLSSQANMTPQQALNLWPQLEATGLELGSPAVAANAATPGDWLDTFMKGARSDGYRVNFITVHWYGSDFVTAAAVNQLEQYLQAIHTRYDLPIWLTEYALINFSGGTTYPTNQQQTAFVTASTNMLQGLSYVQRYSWFAFPATTPGQTGLFSPGGAPTPMGSAYIAAGE